MKYVCVLSTDNYLDGILVLNENLKKVGSKYGLLCLINEHISEETKEILDFFGIETKLVAAVDYKLDGQWKKTFDKVNVFSLIEYQKLVYLDSDLYLLENIDELFSIDQFSMASDLPCTYEGNSAVMVVKPKLTDYINLLERVHVAESIGWIDCGDQLLIREYFQEYKKLDEIYNNMREIKHEIRNQYDIGENTMREKHQVYIRNSTLKEPKVIHYILSLKPWMIDKPFEDEYYDGYNELLKKVRRKKQDYYLSKKKLLVITYAGLLDQNIKIALTGLINQKLSNIHITVVTEGNNEIREFVDSYHKENVNCVDKLSYENMYDGYDYATFFSPQIIIKEACYEDCLRKMLDYNLDCIQFNSIQFDQYAFRYIEKDEIENYKDTITDKHYDKIYKTEILNQVGSLDDAFKLVSNIGILGKAYYDYFQS